ncbi:nucleotidyl transferase AbiEii/AbiGii toxin family protein [Corallococcus exiguus]|uniref:nucleotidyl transferase AbiEii/AbiGii toxin family protein n=1 Tax=Corallococcus exiguus TaxID=83462 RepID=UPI0015601FCB|nr:nucleotidyl transferase AbiEii/AbiGii toxin family protein [Corallococcus exiguus]NRD57389.1 nucleotidyl transferase AbiEii/AbiGii toxin family protein [Corallococcus exiguus]NRD63225.1 nucleotidyl transferase AbiEii/AbiGii toxin family protein [Corallococcus exiguus]
MAIEGGHHGTYDPRVRSVLLAEAVRVVRAFGFANEHVVIIGGLVPPLLVPVPEPGIEPHIGTQDLDLCLSVALIEGNVGAYDKLEKSLRDAGFHMVKGESFRWQGGDLPLTIEFFCPPTGGQEGGRLYRPGGIVGGKLSAIVLKTGALIDRDVRPVEVPVDLPGGGGRTHMRLKVVGPAAYLASKADALQRRNNNKDAYDIVWLIEAWPGGQKEFAAVIRDSSVHDDPLFEQALVALSQEFEDLDAAGARKYARFMSASGVDPDQSARHASSAVKLLLAELAAPRL